MCKLSAEDVVFLQAPGALPSQTVRIKVPIKKEFTKFDKGQKVQLKI